MTLKSEFDLNLSAHLLNSFQLLTSRHQHVKPCQRISEGLSPSEAGYHTSGKGNYSCRDEIVEIRRHIRKLKRYYVAKDSMEDHEGNFEILRIEQPRPRNCEMVEERAECERFRLSDRIGSSSKS